MAGGSSLAAAPQASAPPADVSALVTAIQNAITNAEADPSYAGKSPADQEQALQMAMATAINGASYDAVTEQAALQSFTPNAPTPQGQATAAILAFVNPAATQETQQAASIGGGAPSGGVSSSGGAAAGSSGGSGGGGGYVVPL